MTAILTSQIPCPSCGSGVIHIVPAQLLAGAEFKCGFCETAISLSPQSYSTLKQGLESLDRLTSGPK